MRYPDGYKESVSARIVEAASRALRQDGIDAVSIPKLMKLAGLTHGGFYGHFPSRSDLIAQALKRALDAGEASLFPDAPPRPAAPPPPYCDSTAIVP